jgi:hypothetical protein
MRIHDEIGYLAISANEAWSVGLLLDAHARERRIELRREAAIRHVLMLGRPSRSPRRRVALIPFALARALLGRAAATVQRRNLRPRLGSGDS